jgi:hypothetical protein
MRTASFLICIALASCAEDKRRGQSDVARALAETALRPTQRRAARSRSTLASREWVDGARRGFVILDVSAERVRASWTLFEDIVDPELASSSVAAVFSVLDGVAHWVGDPGPERRP